VENQATLPAPMTSILIIPEFLVPKILFHLLTVTVKEDSQFSGAKYLIQHLSPPG